MEHLNEINDLKRSKGAIEQLSENVKHIKLTDNSIYNQGCLFMGGDYCATYGFQELKTVIGEDNFNRCLDNYIGNLFTALYIQKEKIERELSKFKITKS